MNSHDAAYNYYIQECNVIGFDSASSNLHKNDKEIIDQMMVDLALYTSRFNEQHGYELPIFDLDDQKLRGQCKTMIDAIRENRIIKVSKEEYYNE